MVKYIKVGNVENGFIVKDDYVTLGLSFIISAIHDGFSYLKVEGDEQSIDSWKTRVSGEEVDYSVIESVLHSIEELTPNKKLEILQESLELVILEMLSEGM